MKLKQTGSVFINHGLWYYSVQLPGEKRRKQVPLRTDVYTFDALADEMVRKAAPAVEALG